MQQVDDTGMKRKGDELLSGDFKAMKVAVGTEDKEVQVFLEELSKEDDLLLKQFMRSGLNVEENKRLKAEVAALQKVKMENEKKIADLEFHMLFGFQKHNSKLEKENGDLRAELERHSMQMELKLGQMAQEHLKDMSEKDAKMKRMEEAQAMEIKRAVADMEAKCDEKILAVVLEWKWKLETCEKEARAKILLSDQKHCDGLNQMAGDFEEDYSKRIETMENFHEEKIHKMATAIRNALTSRTVQPLDELLQRGGMLAAKMKGYDSFNKAMTEMRLAYQVKVEKEVRCVLQSEKAKLDMQARQHEKDLKKFEEDAKEGVESREKIAALEVEIKTLQETLRKTTEDHTRRVEHMCTTIAATRRAENLRAVAPVPPAPMLPLPPHFYPHPAFYPHPPPYFMPPRV